MKICSNIREFDYAYSLKAWSWKCSTDYPGRTREHRLKLYPRAIACEDGFIDRADQGYFERISHAQYDSDGFPDWFQDSVPSEVRQLFEEAYKNISSNEKVCLDCAADKHEARNIQSTEDLMQLFPNGLLDERGSDVTVHTPLSTERKTVLCKMCGSSWKLEYRSDHKDWSLQFSH